MTEQTQSVLQVNRTTLRHNLLRAIDTETVTVLTTLSFKPGATRALDLFKDSGAVCYGKGASYELTQQGRELLEQWNGEVA